MVAMRRLAAKCGSDRKVHGVVYFSGILGILLAALAGVSLLAAQEAPPATPTQPAVDYSGMYSFLQEGEFIQFTVEDEGQITGFISRYGDSDAEHGAFVDHFIKQGKLAGKKVNFSTETAKGVWFEFHGEIGRGTGKNAADEGYYVLKGVLTRHEATASKAATAKSQDVAFKSFPQDIDSAPDK
jgi:hypothetical protein